MIRIKKITIVLFSLAIALISCRPGFKTKKISLVPADIESVDIAISGDSIKCTWRQLTDKGIKLFVDKWNNSTGLIGRIDPENSHPTLVLVVFLKNNTSRRFYTYGQFIQEDQHDFFLDFIDKNAFMNLPGKQKSQPH